MGRKTVLSVLRALFEERAVDGRAPCAYCGDRLRRERLTGDHVVPRSRGGQDERENLVLACSPCNLEKGSLDAGVFRAWLASPAGIEWHERGPRREPTRTTRPAPTSPPTPRAPKKPREPEPIERLPDPSAKVWFDW